MAKNANGIELTWRGNQAGVLTAAKLELVESFDPVSPGLVADRSWRNMLVHGENGAVMQALTERLGSRIDLIYADPPLITGGDYRLRNGSGKGILAYRDGRGLDEYLQMLYERLLLMHRLLAETGSLYLHVDWRVGHHAKLLLDEVFGKRGFRNTIVWHHGGRGAKAISGRFPRNYDMLFYYGKTPAAHFHRPYGTIRIPIGEARRRGLRKDEQGRWFKTAPRGDYTDASVRRLEAEGRVHHTTSGQIRIKYFLEEHAGNLLDRKALGDVWTDIPDMMHAAAEERTGYPTQKPVALLERIIEASSDEGGLVADFFCGAGTSLVAAERLGRKWIGCDAGEPAIETSSRRLQAAQRRSFDLYRATTSAIEGGA